MIEMNIFSSNTMHIILYKLLELKLNTERDKLGFN